MGDGSGSTVPVKPFITTTTRRRLKHVKYLWARHLRMNHHRHQGAYTDEDDDEEEEQCSRPPTKTLAHFRKARTASSNDELDSYYILTPVGAHGPYFASEVISGSMNPAWPAFDLESIITTTSPCTCTTNPLSLASASKFTVTVYAKRRTETSFQTCFQRTIHMSRLVYLGSEIDEGRRYPPNSLIFGLKGGVYLHDGTLPVTDDLEEGCDDNDLVFQKVPPNKVLASYRYESILRILTAQKHLFETRQAQLATTESGERILNLKDHHLRTEWTRLKSRLAYTEKTIMGLSEDVKNGRQRHIEIREKMASIGSDLDTARGKREIQERELEGLKVGVVMLRDEIYSKTIKVKSRQRELISSLSTLFPITYNDSTTTYTIKSLPLPHSDFTGHDEDGIATALGYTAQCVTTLAMYLGVALRYRIRPMSSRSSIVDPVSELAGGSNEFPLFGKGSEKLRFEYAVFLLNKNIEQIMSTLRLTVSNLRWTLPNLQSILVETQNWPSISEEGEWNDSLESRIPPDTIIIGDHQQQQQQQLETEVLLTIIPEEEGGFSTPRAMSLTNHPDDDILLPQPNNNNLPSSSTSESPTPTPTSSSPIPKRSGIAAFFGYARVQSQPSSPGL